MEIQRCMMPSATYHSHRPSSHGHNWYNGLIAKTTGVLPIEKFGRRHLVLRIYVGNEAQLCGGESAADGVIIRHNLPTTLGPNRPAGSARQQDEPSSRMDERMAWPNYNGLIEVSIQII